METKNSLSFSVHVGKKIKFFRCMKNYSVQELASIVHKSSSTISKYENGLIPLNLNVLYDIAVALNVPLEEFVNYKHTPHVVARNTACNVFGNKNSFYIYQYDGRTKKITKSYLCLRSKIDNKENCFSCCCYMDLESFDEPENCKYFYTGTAQFYDLVSYVDLINTTNTWDEISFYILNPFHEKQKCWGLMTALSYNPITPFVTKILFSTQYIADRDLDVDLLLLSREDMKRAKRLNMLLLNSQEP